jgi:hypothetical protein
LAIAALALLAYIYGRQLTRRTIYASLAEQVSVSLALGLGVITYLIFFVGLVGLLYKSVVLLTLLTGALLCYPTWREWLRAARGQLAKARASGGRKWATLGGAGLVLVVLAPLLALPLYPPTSFDATSYHLTLAKTYVLHHKIIVTPYLRFQVFPMINEMGFTLALLLYDDILAHLFQLLCLSALVGAVYAFGQRYFSARAGVWAAALLLASPMVLWCGSNGYIDISLLLFLTVAVYSFANWYQSGARHWLVLTGVFFGCAAGVKYTAFVFLGLVGLACLYKAVRARDFSAPFILSMVALAVAAPWYIRNYVYTHNPLFPFLPELFGYSWWSAEDVHGVMQDLRETHGVGRSPRALLSLPWHLLFNQGLFSAEAPWSPLYVLALPLTIVWAFKHSRVRWLLALCFSYTVFWFYAGQILRYLLPVLPFLSLATAAALDGLLLRLRPAKSWPHAKWLVGGGAFILAFSGWFYSVAHWYEQGPFPVTRAQRDVYLSKHLPSYPAYRLLNSLKQPNVRLYSFHDENMTYFVNGETMGDWFGPARYARLLPHMTRGAALYDELKKLGVNYLLINSARFKEALPEDQFFQDNFQIIYARGSLTLFRLTDEATGRRGDTQLLRNVGFESLGGEWPLVWRRAGNPVVDRSGAHAKNGHVAVRCLGAENTFFQIVAVKPEAQYVLSYMARQAEAGHTARLQVNWSDSQSQFISTDIELCDAGPAWRRCAMNVKAPPQAASAIVFTSCHNQSSVWFDDFSFVELQSTTEAQNLQAR